VFPSLYEGFGLPILEAMACGTPVIASNVSSIPEVAGDAAALIPPDDPEEWKDAIEILLDNPILRKELSEKGIERARAFSWQKTALETMKVFTTVLSETQR